MKRMSLIYLTRFGVSKWQNPATSNILSCSADTQLHLEAGLSLKSWTITIFMEHIRNSVFHSGSVTPYMSGPSLSEVATFTGVKLAPIFITLQKSFYLFTSDYSIKWLIMLPVIQSLEENTQICFSHSVINPVCLSSLIYIFNCSRQCVGRSEQLQVGGQKWQWQNLWDQYWATKLPLGFHHPSAPSFLYSNLLELLWSWWSAPHTYPKRDGQPAVVALGISRIP